MLQFGDSVICYEIMNKIKTAMILCAGLGRRMGELTANLPKPAIEIVGKSFVHRVFDMLIEHGIENIVINSHYLADRLLENIRAYPRLSSLKIDFLFEPVLLETAGGVINAIDTISEDDFFVVNGDILFTGYSQRPLALLENNYKKQNMDCIILLHHKEKVFGYHSNGDFGLKAADQYGAKFGILDADTSDKPFVHAGIYIFNKKFFLGFDKGPRKMMDVFASHKQSNGCLNRVFGVVNDGYCLHIGDKATYNELSQYLADNNLMIE